MIGRKIIFVISIMNSVICDEDVFYIVSELFGFRYEGRMNGNIISFIEEIMLKIFSFDYKSGEILFLISVCCVIKVLIKFSIGVIVIYGCLL